jgi:hypothetical protein
MRAQLLRKKLMPVFGAGVGRAVGLPDWNELVRRISDHPDVSGAGLDVMRGSNTSRTQMLFQFFRARRDLSPDNPTVNIQTQMAARERAARTHWFSIIKDCLYANAKPAESHPYLRSFISIVKQAQLTVNYNFDDYIEELLDRDFASDQNRERRGYETVWEPTVQYRYDHGVIYHPNGFLPRDLQRGSSPWLVFAEDSFADQLIEAQQGHYSTLLSHMFRYTGLFIGLSLDDPTLKHLLRQSARANPGHVHYYVSYRNEDEKQNVSRDEAVRASNFETYNLVTLFLTSKEIAALARLLAISDQELALCVSELDLPKSFTYFLSGAVGAGKTTALGHFKSLTTFDEWIDPKPPLILKAADTLTEAERREVDQWINTQFRRKNFLISRVEHSVCVIDRSLLDPIAFASDRAVRAAELKSLYTSKTCSVASGLVLVFSGNPEVMNARILQRHKEGSTSYISTLQDRFSSLWSLGDQSPPPGIRQIDTVDRSIHEVVKEISRVIHMEPYVTAPLDSILENIATGGLNE